MTLKEQFMEDLARAKPAEQLVMNTLKILTNSYTFVDVSDNTKCYSKGDIKAIDKNGNEYYIEVKDDSRIGDTSRILCEDEVYFKDSDYYKPGFMHSNYEYYCVVSQSKRTIYIFNFKKLQEIYKKGEYKYLEYPHQASHVYLLDLCIAKRYGALMYKLKY